MTNADKFLRDGASVEELVKELCFKFYEKRVANYAQDKITIQEVLTNYFNEEVTPTLTEDERVILKQVSKAYVKFGKNGYGQFIFRIDNGMPFLLNDTAEKIFDGLFQFIKERRRI